MKKITTSLITFAIVGSIGMVLYGSSEEQGMLAEQSASLASLQNKPHVLLSDSRPETFNSAMQEDSGEENALDERSSVIAMLQNKFGGSITNRHSQIKAVEKLVAYLQKKYGDDWLRYFEEHLAEAFPEYADALLELYANMEQYNEWFIGERQNMMAMTPEERSDLLWNMRESFFGEAAKEIWAEALKGEKVYDSLREINDSDSSVGFDEHHESYMDSIAEAYGDRTEHMLNNRRQEFVDRFLSIQTIQNRLQEMAKEERYQALSEFRRSMGMDEDAVGRWQELDQVRDQRWEQGRRYMEEKKRLETNLNQADYQVALAKLQGDLFGDFAEIIRNEEESGYYRFEEIQLFGKN